VSDLEPYYDDGTVTLWHGDCREVTAWLDADMLVTDPPYGSNLLSPGNGNAGGYGRRYVHSRGREGATIAGDGDTGLRDWALAQWGSGPAAIFASPRMPEPPGPWEDRLVWDKRRPGMNGGPFRYSHESVFARGMTRASDSAFSVISALPDQRDHIHAKPLKVMEWLVSACPPGVIADPFAGSGSTLVAARNLGRRAVGVEISERYCELAARRLSQMTLEAL
jgi:site-specific DNA-methyltransferase (adenine-specific)